ncbi:sugar-phosphatase [Enterococcus nangangensis]
MTIQLVTIDIDGTLLNDRREVLPRVKTAIQKAQQLGVKIVLCTGRPITGVQNLLKELAISGPEQYVVTYNGSLVQTAEGQTLVSHALTYDDYLEIEMTSRKIPVPLHVHLGNPARLISTKRDINPYTVHESFLVSVPLAYRAPEEITPADKIIKMMYIDEAPQLEAALKHLPPHFYEKYTCVRSAPFFFEILNKKASKGQALMDLANQLNIPLSATMAIGDNENDLSMIETAGLGVAMGNGIDLVKEQADFITTSNEEAGVAYALEKFVLA